MIDYALLKKELRQDEGVRLEAYRDSKGFWTIGVGHLLGDSPRMSSITEEECDALLSVDVWEAEAAARRIFPKFDEMNDVRQRAIVNMVFNRGEGRMRESSKITPAILKASESGRVEDWQAVRAAIEGSQWASQVKTRAEVLAGALADGIASA